MFQRILFATDLSDASKPARDQAVSLAKKLGSFIFMIHVVEIPPAAYVAFSYSTMDPEAPLGASARAAFDKGLADLRDEFPQAEGILASGIAWEEIVAAAQKNQCDLVVTGTHGHRGIRHALLGSVAEHVVRLSPVPVLTIRTATKR